MVEKLPYKPTSFDKIFDTFAAAYLLTKNPEQATEFCRNAIEANRAYYGTQETNQTKSQSKSPTNTKR
jgi:hypothetical protein